MSGSEGPWDGEPIAEAIEVDKAASAPRFLALAFGLALTASLRSVGVVCGGFIGVGDDEGLFRELGMAGERMVEVRLTRDLPL